MEVYVGSATYHAALSPAISEFHREHPEIPVPEQVYAGRLLRYNYDLDGDRLEAFLKHLKVSADELDEAGKSDEMSRVRGLTVRRDHRRIMKSVQEGPAE